METFWKRAALPLILLLTLTACGSQPADEEEPEMVTLIYANLTENGVDKSAVNKFNSTHKRKGVCIEVRDYFDEDGRSGIDRLITEMASGNVPDIIDLGDSSSGLPYRQLARKGYLEDLWPYINNDPDLNNGQLWEGPLKAAEVDGGLYTIFSKVGVNTLVGNETIVGSGYSWTLEELRDAFAAMPEESTVLEYYLTKSKMFYYMFRMSLDGYVDWETGENTFDSESFRAALEFVNSFPSAFPSLEFEGGWEKAQLETQDRVRHGEQMLSVQDIRWAISLPALDKVYARGGQISFIGYPVEDGSAGSVFTIMGRKLAMSSTCKAKEAAWEFLRKMLMPQYHNANAESVLNGSWGFPLNRADFDLIMQSMKRPPSYYKFGASFFGGAVEVNVKVNSSHVERLEDFLDHIDKIELYDTALYDIVYEASGPYFAGDKTLDETVQIIQNRVALYINEQK